jgi:rRNA processing protein Gar1
MNKSALKLFVLRHSKGGAVVKGEDGKPIYFNDKMIAKQNRKEGQVVSFGPDHNKFKGGL